ncbi:hypothetical protein ACFX12_021368 [Malus domestica]
MDYGNVRECSNTQEEWQRKDMDVQVLVGKGELEDTAVSLSKPRRQVGKGADCYGSLVERLRLQKEREENEHQAWDATFDAGLIGPWGVVAEGVENVVLNVHVEEEDGGKTVCVSQESGEAIDLNITVPGVDETTLRNRGFGHDNEQDSNPFDLALIIEAISKKIKGKKWMNTEIECEIGVVGIAEVEERRMRTRNVTLYNEADETSLEGSPRAP